MHRLRDFIKHVYVDRKYTGEISQETLPRIKMVTFIYIFMRIILFKDQNSLGVRFLCSQDSNLIPYLRGTKFYE